MFLTNVHSSEFGTTTTFLERPTSPLYLLLGVSLALASDSGSLVIHLKFRWRSQIPGSAFCPGLAFSCHLMHGSYISQHMDPLEDLLKSKFLDPAPKDSDW